MIIFPFSSWNATVGPIKSLIPTMTSNITPNGIASDSVNNSTAFNAFNSTGFSAGNNTLKYTFPSPHIITSWSLSNGGFNNWSSIVLQGSVNGISWVTLATLVFNQYGATITDKHRYSRFQFIFNVMSMPSTITQLSGY